MSTLREAKDLFKIAVVASQLQKEAWQTCPWHADVICFKARNLLFSSPLRNTFSTKTASRIKSRFCPSAMTTMLWASSAYVLCSLATLSGLVHKAARSWTLMTLPTPKLLILAWLQRLALAPINTKGGEKHFSLYHVLNNFPISISTLAK